MSTIEERLKESYRPSFGDDAWVDELFADQLKKAEEETEWYSAVCTKCPFFVDGAKTGNTTKKLVECDGSDPLAVAQDISKLDDKMSDGFGGTSDTKKTFKWVDVPLIQCMKSVEAVCVCDSFIVTAWVFSLIQQEKQAMEYMRERIMQAQTKFTKKPSKRSRRSIKSRRR